jgi:thymidylate synthase ThyX
MLTDRILAKVIADSQPPEGARLTTMEVVVPRIVLAEFNTHRVFSRNSASSRAIPVEKMIKRVKGDPYVPEIWTSNQKGMQGEVITDPDKIAAVREEWITACFDAIGRARALLALGIHKQTTNRLLEPFMWHTIIVTATEWSNFFHLRCHPAAHPAIRNTAKAMRWALEDSVPEKLQWGDWHLPFIRKEDWNDLKRWNFTEPVSKLVKISSARCARVSYLTHDGVRDPAKDLELHDRLLAPGHMSPFEHPAQAVENRPEGGVKSRASNFARPWIQYRKMIPFEWDVHSDPERKAANE